MPSIQKPNKGKDIQTSGIAPFTMTIGDNISTFLDSTITIQCKASGVFKPTIAWFKDDKAIEHGKRLTVDPMGNLVLRKVIKSDSGSYACVATNLVGTDTVDSNVIILSMLAIYILT